MFAFDWLADPTAWAGLLTLVVLEIVLGIDNLVFVAILADRLPSAQRDRARVNGLAMALLMRLVLLGTMSWLVTLTHPLLVWHGFALSLRDIILLVGGLFLLLKATLELHERLEGGSTGTRARGTAAFWVVVLQIVVLDAVFSLDSVITAVGMVDELSIMMLAVVLAMLLMITASRPLTAFINARPTVVILCLGFLLMIGFSLVADGLGFHIPKGYLYAAIGFSILIEALNQGARRNRERSLFAGALTLRDRTSEAVLRLLGTGRAAPSETGDSEPDGEERPAPVFGAEERAMVQGVLDLAERPVRTIMTPRKEMLWLDLDADAVAMRARVESCPHHWMPVAHGDLDHCLGVATAREITADLLQHGRVDTEAGLRRPLLVLENLSVLRLIDEFRRSPVQIALVVDEYGGIEGIVTPRDVLEVIAGRLSEGADSEPAAVADPRGGWLFDGGIDLRRVEHLMDRRLQGVEGFGSLAGLVLERLARLPQEGDHFDIDGLRVQVVTMDGARIARVRVSAVPSAGG